MAHHPTLEGIAENAWDVDSSLKRNLEGYWKRGKEEAFGHKFIEAGCVGFCALGDAITTYNTGSNILGYFGGVGFGLAYGLGHVYIEAMMNGIKARLLDVVKVAGTAESGCAISATLVPLAIASVWGAGFDPSSIKDIVTQEAIAYPFALPIGLSAMSGLSLLQKNTAGRIIADKEALFDAADFLKDKYAVNDNRDSFIKSRRFLTLERPFMEVYGEKSSLRIRENKVPKMHLVEGINPKNSSLYRVFSPAARISEEAKKSAEYFLCNALKGIGLEGHKHVKDPYEHKHKNDDHNHPHSHAA